MAEILVVDDDLDTTEIIKELLQRHGHVVRLAADGAEGLAELEDRVPDVVLLDIEMPVLTGPDMAYQMFVHDLGMERIPLILASGAADASSVAKAIGTPYVLDKPYGLDALFRVIQKAISERIAPMPSPSFFPRSTCA